MAKREPDERIVTRSLSGTEVAAVQRIARIEDRSVGYVVAQLIREALAARVKS